MTRLTISLLGPFRVTLNGDPVTQFRTETARALLAYLAMHPDVPCRRDALAALFWPDYTDAAALRNLRVTLNRLRTAIGDRESTPPTLQVTNRTVQLNPEVDIEVDIHKMESLIYQSKNHEHTSLCNCESCIHALEKEMRYIVPNKCKT